MCLIIFGEKDTTNNKDVIFLAGYIDFNNLNQELQDMILNASGGNFKTIEPTSVTTTYDSAMYPDGTSAFILHYDENKAQTTDAISESWLSAIYSITEDYPYSTFQVTTSKRVDGIIPLVVQKVEIIKDGFTAEIYVRAVDGDDINGYEWFPFIEVSGSGNTPIQPAVRTVNLIPPDNNGNVDTYFKITDVIEPWVLWNDDVYPEGVSEFVTVWDKVKYAQFIIDNPSFEKLPEGRMMVRTHKITGSLVPEVWQELDTSEDGIFHATFARLGAPNGEWGELNADNSNHVLHIDWLPPTAPMADYPTGVSIFRVHYEEGDLSWYEALNLMPVDVYEEETGHKPYGDITVTSFKNKTLVNQVIQVQDAMGYVGTYSRFWSEELGMLHRWQGGANRTNGVDGIVKKVNNVAPDKFGNIAITSLPPNPSDLPKASLTQEGIVQLTDEPGGTSNSLALTQSGAKKLGDAISLLSIEVDSHIDKMASETVLGHVKIDGTSIIIDENGVISSSGNIEWGDF